MVMRLGWEDLKVSALIQSEGKFLRQTSKDNYMVLNVVFIENNGSHFNLLVFTFRLHLVIDNVSLQRNEYNTNDLKVRFFNFIEL